MKRKDYTRHTFYITLIVVVILLCVSTIPPQTFGKVKLKRANIISEIYKYHDELLADAQAEIGESDRAFIEEMERTEQQMNAEAKEEQAELTTQESWNIGGGGEFADAAEGGQKWVSEDGEEFPLVEIENYTEQGDISIADFASLLGSATEQRVVRIGFLGDSYIEGDIISADVRQQLQERYGGGGVGFVPFETPLAANRPTIKHTFGNWQNYNLIYKRNAPEEMQERYYISGIVSVPDEGAWSRYENVNFRRNLKRVSTARFIFTNTAESQIHLVVNDTIERSFTPMPNDLPQQINISGGSIQSISLRIDNAEGFYGYGVVMEARRGVSVDNYSIRGNSGLALFGTNSAVNRAIDRALGYDLIVLQYGLNIMEAEVTGYASYGKQLRRMIKYMKNCFPRAIIVVMGVGDRAMQKDGEFVTMPAVSGIVAEQRMAAKECGVAFWSIYDVMMEYGGMVGFVEKGWAAKDYTHLSYSGGRKIATEFVKALEKVKNSDGESNPKDYGTGGEMGEVRSLSTFDLLEKSDSLNVEDGADTLIKDSLEKTETEIINTTEEGQSDYERKLLKSADSLHNNSPVNKNLVDSIVFKKVDSLRKEGAM